MDRTYLKNLFRIALPIIFMNFVSAALNMIDITMIGQLGEVAVASVGLANQVSFLQMLILFGVSSGSGVFVAQFWGRGDIENIHKVQGISLTMGLAASSLFTILAIGFPQFALGVFTNDPQVIAQGAAFLRIVGISYLTSAVTFSFSAVLRATGNVQVPVVVSIAAILLKTFLNYCLIFGNFGFPTMGIIGAAIATVISRFLEMSALLLITYLRKLPTAAHPRELLSGLNRKFSGAVLKTSLPVVINESLWSLGVTVYSIVYAHIGTQSIAAVNIAGTIENLAFVLFFGLSEACGILVGHRIGANQEDQAFLYARRTLILSVVAALFMGLVIFLTSGMLLGFYKISAEAMQDTQNILLVMSLALWVKVTNLIIIVGILRAGGDTRFSMFLDAGSVWLVGVPLACLGAFVFKLPVYSVYLMVVSEEAVKCVVGIWRFRSRRWMTNLTQSV